MRALFVFLGLGLALMPSTVFAGRTVAPPTAPLNPFDVAPEARRPFAMNFRLGGFASDMASVPLAQVPVWFGAGGIDRLGRDDGFVWVCYDLTSQKQRVWLISTAAADGFVDGIVATGLASGDSGGCPALPAKYQPFVLDRDIRIGMTRAEVIGVLGTPSRAMGDWLVYSGRADNVRLGLTLKFEADRLVFLSAGQQGH